MTSKNQEIISDIVNKFYIIRKHRPIKRFKELTNNILLST